MRWLLSALACAAVWVGDAAAQTMLFADSYSVNGRNADGSTYSGTATVRVVSDTTIRVNWKTGDSFSGFGMRWGDMVAVSYDGQDMKGLVMYRADPATGVLTGKWTVLGQDGIGEEILTPRR